MSDRILCNCGSEIETLTTPEGINISPLMGCRKCNKVFTMMEGGRLTTIPNLTYKEVSRKITGVPDLGQLGGKYE